MDDETRNEAQEQAKESRPVEREPETTDTGGSEAPTQTAPEKDWDKTLEKAIKDPEAAKRVADMLRGQEIAAPYINVTIIEGKVTGSVYSGSSSAWRPDRQQMKEGDVAGGRVLGRELNKIKTVYVPPENYEVVEQQLRSKHIVVLHGQAQYGKRTTALHLLWSLHRRDCFEISPNVDWEKLRLSDLQQGAGYMIDTLSMDSAKRLNSFVLNSLSTKLKELGSHLLITIDSRVSLAKQDLSNYSVQWNMLPDYAQVLEQHLDLYAADATQRSKAQKLLQQEAVQQALQSRPLLYDIDRLAQLLVEVASGEYELAEALSHFRGYAKEQVENWFLHHTDLEERTFMLALAVFNGANYNYVIDADDRLHTLIRPAGKEQASASDDWFFGLSRSQQISEAGAQLKPGHEETEFGLNPVKLVVFDNPTMQPAVLNYAWREYGRLRKLLLNWLYEFGLSNNFEVRTRAAAAVGALSRHDFGYVRGNVVLPWANHEDSRARMAAAFALGVPAWEGAFAPQVLGLLHHWSTLSNNWRLCSTAASAYGGLVGRRFPDAALQDLGTMAEYGDLRLLGVIAGSTAALFEMGRFDPDYYDKVFSVLLAWTDDTTNLTLLSTGLLIFLILAARAQVEAEPEGKSWPALLWLAKKDDVYHKNLTTMWRRALNTKATRRAALEGLRQWLLAVDDDDRLYEALKQLIVALATHGRRREQDRLLFYLNRWATHPKNPSKAATRLLPTIRDVTK